MREENLVVFPLFKEKIVQVYNYHIILRRKYTWLKEKNEESMTNIEWVKLRYFYPHWQHIMELALRCSRRVKKRKVAFYGDSTMILVSVFSKLEMRKVL